MNHPISGRKRPRRGQIGMPGARPLRPPPPECATKPHRPRSGRTDQSRTSREKQTIQQNKLSTQSAAERRWAEAELRTLIAKFVPKHLRLVGAMRRSLRKRLPTAHEVVYEYRSRFVISYSPSEQGYEGVLAIRGDADGIKLYFNQGKTLPDPEKLLQGSAQARFIDVEAASTLARPAVARLIDEAIAHNHVPFARAGRGPVVIRSSSAKKRRRPA